MKKGFLPFTLMVTVIAAGLAPVASAQTILYQQSPTGAAQVIQSSIVPPDGVDGNMMIWDAFTLSTTQAISTIRWRGGFTNFLSGAGESPVLDFTVSIHASIGAGTQPDVVSPPLVQYSVGGNAGETYAATYGNIPMYDYQFTLPSPFVAVGGTRYWLQIVAQQMPTPFYFWPPDWGFAAASGGDGSYFRAILGGTGGGGTLYQTMAGDAAFTLLAAPGSSWLITASESPAGSGTVLGAGPYPAGSLATLTATPATGFTFQDWTENGVTVSIDPAWSFTVTADRTVVANFVPASVITTSAEPIYGGTTAGDGLYANGTNVTVVATPSPGFIFVDWTEFGTPVSSSASYTFTAAADCALVAHFIPGGLSAMFDFDTGTPALVTGQGIPLVQTSNGVTAHFDSPQGSVFSIQTDTSTGWHMTQFSGHYVSDNNLNRNTLQITFDHALDGIYFVFATADFNQNEVPTTLQLTAYSGSTALPPVGTASAHGAYIGSTMPMGTLSFNSPASFNIVQIVLPYQPLGCTDFLVDQIMVAVHGASAVPDAPPAVQVTLAATPNPTRGATDLSFAVPAGGGSLAVFDVMGRRIRQIAEGTLTSGSHVIRWDGRDDAGAMLPAGAYIVRLTAPGQTLTRKVVLVH